MRILQVHNDYQISGGETQVVENEKKLLESFGDIVLQYKVNNSDISEFNFFGKINLAFNLLYSYKTKKNILKVLQDFKPDIVHIHNVFPLISPTIYSVILKLKIPIVQTLHNFRFLCPNGLFYTKNNICEKCSKGNYYNAVINKCFRKSVFLSFLYSFVIWLYLSKFKKINKFISLSNFSKSKYVSSGFDKSKIFIKPNFIQNFPLVDQTKLVDNYIMYMGRLSIEKGILQLLEIAKTLPHIQIRVLGDGPLKVFCENFIKINNIQNIFLCGFVNGDDKLELIRNSRFLVFPSVCYENFPLSIVEVFSLGKTVIASNLGSIPELVIDNHNGILYKPGDIEDLKMKIQRLYDDKNRSYELGNNALLTAKQLYNKELNYHQLIEIYKTTRDAN